MDRTDHEKIDGATDLRSADDLELDLGGSGRGSFCHIVPDPPAIGEASDEAAHCGEAGPFRIVGRNGKKMCPDCVRREAERKRKP